MYYNKTSIHTANCELENRQAYFELGSWKDDKQNALKPPFKCIIKFQIEKVK